MASRRPERVSGKSDRTWLRRIVGRLPFSGAVLGMALVFSSVIVFEDEYAGIAAIALGLLALLTGIWYAAHPYFKSERQNIALREEVHRFIELVRALHRASTGPNAPEAIADTTSRMHEAVDRMGTIARRRVAQAQP